MQKLNCKEILDFGNTNPDPHYFKLKIRIRPLGKPGPGFKFRQIGAESITFGKTGPDPNFRTNTEPGTYFWKNGSGSVTYQILDPQPGPRPPPLLLPPGLPLFISHKGRS